MKRDEALKLLRTLRAAFPATKVDDDTSELWLAELRRLDRELGEQAVRSLVTGLRFWPSLAELHEQVTIAREQAALRRRALERRAAEEEFEQLPRPPLREIPAAQALLERWQGPEPPLERVPAGTCDECGREGERYRLGRFALCRADAARRLRLRTELERTDDGEAA